MLPPNVKRSFVQAGTTYYVLVPLIIGLHVGWFALQQRHVPESERHDHPVVRLYKKFIA